VAGELRIKGNGKETVYNNRPSDVASYRSFRQLITHISSVQDRHNLYVEPLQFQQILQIPAGSIKPEELINLQNEYKVEFNTQHKQLILTKPVTGHIILSNYDPQLLSNAERIKLNEEADKGAINDLMIDIRSDYPSGEVPIHGFFRLRSFYNVLNFIGRDIDDEREFAVDKLPSTPQVSENPMHSLEIVATKDKLENAMTTVEYNGLYYAVKPETGYQWNREGFRLLHQIFQMTMAELSQRSAPAITISK
jgi:hypothetical protein